jgi:hypothetical protein
MNTATYDPTKVVINIDGHTIVNYADGTFIEASQMEDTYSEHVGVDGKVTRVKSANKMGEVTLTLAQNSPSNKKLQELAKNGNIVQFSVTDANFEANVGASGSEAWLRKPADFSRGNEIEDAEWVIVVADYEAAFDSEDAGTVNSTEGGSATGAEETPAPVPGA